MLVLSRHTNQKILFPNLGISVQVVETRKGSVRLGIEAPPEIRIIRDELYQFDRPAPAREIPPPTVPGCENAEQFRRHLDAANLAIHLARNQLKQGLDEHASDALEQALASLQALEQSCKNGQAIFTVEPCTLKEPLAVRESEGAYQVHSLTSQPLSIAFLERSPTANQEELAEIVGQKIGQPVNCEFVASDHELIERVRSGPDVDIVLISSISSIGQQSVCVPKVLSMRPFVKPIDLGRQKAIAWVSQRVDLSPSLLDD